MKNFFKFVVVSLSLLASQSAGYSEGGGNRTAADFGINRRVNSKAKYTGVQGTFTISAREVPTTPEGLGFDKNFNPNVNHDVPTAYLGSSGPVEVDAGLQYYGQSHTYPSNYTVPAGWGAYISNPLVANDLKYTNPKVFDIKNHEWHGIRWSADTYTMIYQVDEANGTVTLTVNGLSYPWTDQKPPDPDTHTIPDKKHFPLAVDGKRIYQQSQMGDIGVKRVIGMTQGDPGTPQGYTLDGSIVTATYSGGQVKKKAGSWVPWTPDIVNQTKNHTGYDVAQDAKDAKWGGMDGKDTVFSQYILTFPNIESYTYTNAQGTFTIPAESNDPSQATTRKKARTNDWPTTLLTENEKSRYVEETIKISLRSATKVTGEKSTVRSKSK